MKTFFLLAIGIMLSILSFSQITIEEADLMMPSDTFLIHVDLNPTISPDLTPGANLTWDFTGLQNDESNYACYAPSNDLDFIDEFPQAEFYTYGPGYIYAGPGGGAPLENWGYMMFFTNPDGLFAEGFYSDYGMGYRSTFNTPAELLMFTPANYLDEETNNSYWEVVVNENVETPINVDSLYRRDVDKNLFADAWGTLTTDFGTYDVLRIHETGISVDSVFGYDGTITYFSMEYTRDTINNYYFWTKELRNPLMTLHCDYDGNIERIDYLMGAIYAQNNFETINKQSKIYPNPAKDFIVFENFTNNIKIYNSLGQVVRTIKNPNPLQKVSISDLPKGLYFVKDNNNKAEKLIIEF
ncbi:MAG: T9SS type A sorting domain-containing protein [Bacteroidales bacterium]|nr:T9SS type A sorting domain-containing protein [Bacteroidales bacterium]